MCHKSTLTSLASTFFSVYRAAMVFPKVEPLLQSSIQPYISSILEALMEPTSRGFSEVREVLFRELVELSKNSLNGGGKEKLGEVGETSSPYNFMITMTIRPEFFKKDMGLLFCH